MVHISPSIPAQLRDALNDFTTLYDGRAPIPIGPGFCDAIFTRLVVSEALVTRNGQTGRVSGRLTVDVEVTANMLNGIGTIHGGCIAYLVDVGSTLCFMAAYNGPHVSQSLNITYHSPAIERDKLSIISTTMTLGNRVLSAQTEIWNMAKRCLVASAVHVKMRPSRTKL